MLTILNDLHIGATRSSGTTPATKHLLKDRILSKFEALLPRDGDLLLNGDLFDATNIASSDLFATYDILTKWLSADKTRRLYNSRGNHDCASSSNVMSSFDLLGKLLAMHFPDRYVHVDEPMNTPHGYIIPHLPNQELFDLALTRVPECDFLFVHVNIMSNFAAQSDQSLNMSREQIAACPAKQIVCAHEHHARTLGKVVIPGNQLATSVADWLGGDDKQYAVIVDGELSLRTCAYRAHEFVEMPWDSLCHTDVPFVRISGAATAEQAAEALAAVAAYRRKSSALVVTNAVKIASTDDNYEQAVANMAGFDVMSMLRDVLSSDEIQILEKL